MEESSEEATTITTMEGVAESARAMACPQEGTGPPLLGTELLQEAEEE